LKAKHNQHIMELSIIIYDPWNPFIRLFLPPELWEHIFSFVDINSILNLSITCKLFRSLICFSLLNKINDVEELLSRWCNIKESKFWYSLIKLVALKRDYVEIDDQPLFIPRKYWEHYNQNCNSRDTFMLSGFWSSYVGIDSSWQIFQTRKLCLASIKFNWRNIYSVKKQTLEICFFAIKRNIQALNYIRNQSRLLCLMAVKFDYRALQYIKEQNNEICLIAIKQNDIALQYVKGISAIRT